MLGKYCKPGDKIRVPNTMGGPFVVSDYREGGGRNLAMHIATGTCVAVGDNEEVHKELESRCAAEMALAEARADVARFQKRLQELEA